MQLLLQLMLPEQRGTQHGLAHPTHNQLHTCSAARFEADPTQPTNAPQHTPNPKRATDPRLTLTPATPTSFDDEEVQRVKKLAPYGIVDVGGKPMVQVKINDNATLVGMPRGAAIYRHADM